MLPDENNNKDNNQPLFPLLGYNDPAPLVLSFLSAFDLIRDLRVNKTWRAFILGNSEIRAGIKNTLLEKYLPLFNVLVQKKQQLFASYSDTYLFLKALAQECTEHSRAEEWCNDLVSYKKYGFLVVERSKHEQEIESKRRLARFLKKGDTYSVLRMFKDTELGANCGFNSSESFHLNIITVDHKPYSGQLVNLQPIVIAAAINHLELVRILARMGSFLPDPIFYTDCYTFLGELVNYDSFVKSKAIMSLLSMIRLQIILARIELKQFAHVQRSKPRDLVTKYDNIFENFSIALSYDLYEVKNYLDETNIQLEGLGKNKKDKAFILFNSVSLAPFVCLLYIRLMEEAVHLRNEALNELASLNKYMSFNNSYMKNLEKKLKEYQVFALDCLSKANKKEANIVDQYYEQHLKENKGLYLEFQGTYFSEILKAHYLQLKDSLKTSSNNTASPSCAK